jgi:hypothetical protein
VGQGYVDELNGMMEWLRDPANAEPCATFPADAARVASAGVYAWHGDAAFNELIERELRSRASPLYVDQAGGDARRTGRPSGATLQSRIVRHHLRGSPRAANFRRSLASLLWDELELRCDRPQVLEMASNARLSAWMREHLSVATVPVADRTKLWLITADLVDFLDPALNLTNLANTPGRKRLRALRRRHFSWSSADADRIERLANLHKFARSNPENEFLKRRIAQESKRFFAETLAQ